MDPLSSIPFNPPDPSPVMRAAPGARVSRDGGRGGQGGDPDAPPRRRTPDEDGDAEQTHPEPEAQAGDGPRHLDVLVDGPADGDPPPGEARPRIDLTA